MNYLILLIMCILATAKLSFQSAFSKKSVKNTADAVAFNSLVFLISAALFSHKIIECSDAVWLYALGGALCSTLFQLTYTRALSIGNVSLTVMIVNFQLVVTVLVSHLVYGDPLSVPRIIGIILTLASFVICTEFRGGKSSEKKWLLYTLTAFLGTAGASVMQKIFGESPYGKENQAYVACLYIIASLITFAVYRFMKRKGQGKSFKFDKRAIILALCVGVSLGVFQAVNTYATTIIPGTVLFPVYSGGTIILSTLSGVFIFKDNLSKKQFMSIVVGIAEIVLMNF